MTLLGRLHGSIIFPRRIRTLSHHLGGLIPANAQVLDVGCGSGAVAHLLRQGRPDIRVRGIDVLVRQQTYIPVDVFDGRTIPHPDSSFDVVMFVDVLHHTDDPMVLLCEAARVARRAIVLKDHILAGFFAGPTLRFMDYVGNAPHGVPLPYNYWSRRRWLEACDTLRLRIAEWKTDLALYPWPATYLFDRSLHFIARLEPVGATGSA